jgi:transcription initiation factor IIF auxiliary subunit
VHVYWRGVVRSGATRMAGTAESFPSKPFVVGSIAHWLGKKAEESRSHEWTVFLRSANPDEDISTYIKKVVFILHPTLQPPTRSE